MVQPEIEGMELLGLVGEGACGSVFIARDLEGSPPTFPDTKWYAVRVFDAISINRPLIENMVKRLDGASYPKGVVPVAWKDSKQGSRCMIMPMLAEVDEQKSTIAPRSLQEQLNNYPSTDAWPVIEKIAEALAEMHQRRIAHGNLKPGNIFFDDDGELYLTDFTMGQMPGIGMLPYTDALLYAPPEQLREPEGYLSGKAYAWDTYAFAVLAFRLLTGKFPRCEATFSKVAPGPGESHVTGIEADIIKLAERLEHRELANWSDESTDDRERKRREVIQKCLSLDPQDRYGGMNEVLHAWETIDSDAKTAREKAGLLKNVKLSKLLMTGSLVLAAAGIVGCIVLASLLAIEKRGRSSDTKTLKETISGLENERDTAKTNEASTLKAKRGVEAREQAFRQQTAARETSFRNQLSALGVTNDHLAEWIMRTTSSELPALQESDPGEKIITRELGKFLNLTNGDSQAGPIRARILMQLAELAIHNKQPAEADKLLDQAHSAWTQAGIKEPGYPSRIARARLACLLQSLDKQDSNFINSLLRKARNNIGAITGGDANETRRINAVMKIIDGSIVQNHEPAKALEHFQLALKDLEGVHEALPEHVAIRSDLAKYTLKSARIADSLDMVDDSAKLRGKAAEHLRWLLKKNPELKLAKVELAEIEILAAEHDMRTGHDDQGTAKLTTAEKLLSGLPADDTSPNGVSMQIAIAKGLRSVLLRDRGRTTDAAKRLDEAIVLTKKIVESNPKANEPLYRLAVLHWQRAGLSGDVGDRKGELDQGRKAADLMQRLLEAGAGRRDTKLRRSLAYLYGDLGHTSNSIGKKTDAISFFKNAVSMWHSLITHDGKKEEYAEGLKWSQSRYRQAGGR